MTPYRFRPFNSGDLPMVGRWLTAPDVERWWGNPQEQLALIAEDLEEPLMRQWIVDYRELPFAYLQAYEAHVWPQTHLQNLPTGAQVIDALIGEPDMIGCGHGSAFLRLFANLLIAAGAPAVATDPDRRNLRARRAYARSGFIEQSALDAEQGPVVLMIYRSQSYAASPIAEADPLPTLRPG